MSIADELALLANTKESLRVAIGLSTSIPFSQYAVNMPWGSDVIPATGIVFDFKKNRYAKDGKAVYLDDVSEFIRLSSATKWHDGQLVEVQDNIPRISSAGLLVEKSVTELIPNNSTITSINDEWVVTNKTDQNIGSVFEFVSDGSTNNVRTGLPLYPNGNVPAASGGYYRSIFVKKPLAESYIRFGTGGANSAIIVDIKNGTLEYSGLGVLAYKITELSGFFKIEVTSKSSSPVNAVENQFLFYLSNSRGIGPNLGVPTLGHSATVALPSFMDTVDFPQSVVKTSGIQVTRSPDILNIPLLPAQTITGDWDAGVTYSLAGGIATFTGHGYIRSITVEEL